MFNAKLVERIEITPNLLVLRVQSEKGVPDFKAGQYVALGLMPESTRGEFPDDTETHKEGKLIMRTYSIASSPDNKDYFEFYLAVVPDGSLSARLACLNQGDPLFCAPKVTGRFTLEAVPEQSDLVFVATGTGLAPFISMLDTQSTWALAKTITLVYGVRYPEDLAYLDYLQKLAEANENFTVHTIISRPQDDWSGNRGYVQDLFKKDLISLSPDNQHIMLCGNPGMVEDMQSLCLEKGFKEHSKRDPGNLHLEKYW